MSITNEHVDIMQKLKEEHDNHMKKWQEELDEEKRKIEGLKNC